VALARHILGSRIGGDENKLSRNISSGDFETNDFLCSVCYSEFFETKFELGNVTKRS
jgi:hypothetical protein